eukprot:jgi/Botrbrau1/2559/Bobra.0079s0045.1
MALSIQNTGQKGIGVAGVSPSKPKCCRRPSLTGVGRAGWRGPQASLQHPYPNANIGSSTFQGDPKCPFSRVAGSLGLAKERVSDRPKENAGHVETPGPSAFSIQSFLDVSMILSKGIHHAMVEFNAKYGPVCRFANPADLNGASGWLFLNDPGDVQWVCATNTKNYSRRYLPDIYKWVTHEKGILGSQGAYNKRHRQLCQPPFRSPALLATFADVIVQRTQLLGDIWGEHNSFSTDVAVQTQRLTLDVVGLVAFSHDFEQTERIRRDMAGRASDTAENSDRLLWAVNTFGEVLAEVFITPFALLRLMDRLGFRQLRLLDEAVEVMRENMLEVIQKRRDKLASGDEGENDLLGVLLQARDEEGQAMTDEELWEDVHDIMGAGHETTATTTAAALHCICSRPEVERRVVQELDSVLGGRAPTYADLDKLQYLTMAIKETLRLYPAIPIFPREAATADRLPSGHRVDPGDVVFMSSYALGRSPQCWDNPEEFRPERFTQEEEARRHRFQWVPFGAGPRMCLGAGFAQMSVTLMVACLLQRFKFVPAHPMDVGYDITLNFQKTNGLHMRVQKRQPAPVGLGHAHVEHMAPSRLPAGATA